jgi:hypothetical protein
VAPSSFIVGIFERDIYLLLCWKTGTLIRSQNKRSPRNTVPSTKFKEQKGLTIQGCKKSVCGIIQVGSRFGYQGGVHRKENDKSSKKGNALFLCGNSRMNNLALI